VTGVNAITSTLRLLKWPGIAQVDVDGLIKRAADKPVNEDTYGMKATNGGMLPIKHTFTAAELAKHILDDMRGRSGYAFPIGETHITVFAGFPCIYDDLSTYRYYIGSKVHRFMKSRVNARTTVDTIYLSAYGRVLVPLKTVIKRLKDNINIFNDPLAVVTDGKKSVITV